MARKCLGWEVVDSNMEDFSMGLNRDLTSGGITMFFKPMHSDLPNDLFKKTAG